MINIPRWVLSADHKLYLGSPTWRAKRIPILERANGHCEKCKRPTKHLQVHHLTYERTGGAELPTDLIAICRRCHLNEHNLTRSGRKRRKGELPSLWNVPPEERRRRKRERRAARKGKKLKPQQQPKVWSNAKKDAIAASLVKNGGRLIDPATWTPPNRSKRHQ